MMKIIYQAANLFDAYLVKHALEDEGIPVMIKGESLLGAAGELPLFGALQVCVPELAIDDARKIINGLDLGANPPIDDGEHHISV